MSACITAFSKSGFISRFGPLAWTMKMPTSFSFGPTRKCDVVGDDLVMDLIQNSESSRESITKTKNDAATLRVVLRGPANYPLARLFSRVTLMVVLVPETMSIFGSSTVRYPAARISML